MADSSTHIELTGVANVLKRKLSVPVHQRSFEWTADEVRELIEDLQGALSSSQSEYFLGSIVVIAAGGSDRESVLDGQQRLATLSLLLAGIVDEFERLGQAERAGAVREYLVSFDIDLGESSPQLRLNGDDDVYFRKLLATEFPEPSAGAPASHQLLFGARKQTRVWLQSHNVDGEPRVTWLVSIFKFLRDAVRVIFFRVPDDANAFLIFETLNDRGLELSIADLLKNYLLGRAEGRQDSVLTLWTRTLGVLKAHSLEKNFTVFLRHYWSSKYEVVREKELYRRVKSRITNAASVVDFAEDLAKNSYLYSAVVSSDHEYWSSVSADARERLRVLHLLGLEQYRPMLLAALVHFEPHEVEKALALLENWNVRLIVVGGLGGGVMEAKYAELAREIRSGDIKNSTELYNRSRSFVPADEVFESSFSTATVSKVGLARYYLSTLERMFFDAARRELIPSPQLTLEHILPERPQAQWPQFTSEQHAASVRRLGNLVLLNHKMNSDLRSASFEEKKPVYAQSSLNLTKAIAGYDRWTVESIRERQAELAKRAVKAWPLKLPQ